MDFGLGFGLGLVNISPVTVMSIASERFPEAVSDLIPVLWQKIVW